MRGLRLRLIPNPYNHYVYRIGKIGATTGVTP